jgi:hypothetical protein
MKSFEKCTCRREDIKVHLGDAVFKDSKLDWIACKITSSGGLV